MSWIVDKFEILDSKIPSSVLNIISIISGICTIGATLIGIVLSFCGQIQLSAIYVIIIIALSGLAFLLLSRMKKYHKMSFDRMKVDSFYYHKMTHSARDVYFDIMHEHKLQHQTIQTLTSTYKDKLQFILDYLCSIMKNYTGQEVYACIKLICPRDDEININNAMLTTFCRSSNSTSRRGAYEGELPNDEIQLINNTDFADIVDMVNGAHKNSFYQSNLKDYDRTLRTQGKYYKNTNPNWEEDYIGTIVVPIQIKFDKLYYPKKDDLRYNSNHLIGFLCVDSLSPNAFLLKQENFNTDTLKAFADIIYILLGQYNHYLKTLSSSNTTS